MEVHSVFGCGREFASLLRLGEALLSTRGKCKPTTRDMAASRIYTIASRTIAQVRDLNAELRGSTIGRN